MEKRPQESSSAGFTLMEMLAVIAIIGFLVAIAMVAAGNFGASTKEVSAKADLRTLRSAIEYHSLMTGEFPPEADWGTTNSPLLTSNYERLFDQFPEDPYNPGSTFGYLLRNEPGEKPIYIAWSLREPGPPNLYGDDRVYLNGVTLYVTNASRIATDVSEIECALNRGATDARSLAGNFLPFIALFVFILIRRTRRRGLSSAAP